MSYSIDVNLLLYASNDDSPLHGRAVGFLEECLVDSELMILSYQTLFAYLRISTHPGIFPQPLEPEEALSNLKHLTERPQVRLIAEGEDFIDVYSEVTGAFPVRGNLVPDAHLASLLKSHGVKTIYTNDSDFLKFPFLSVKNPFSE